VRARRGARDLSTPSRGEGGAAAVEFALLLPLLVVLLFENVSGAFKDTGTCVTDVGAAGSAGC